MEYVLILTLLVSGGNDGQGGLAMESFNNKEACEKAGLLWEDKLAKAASGGFSGVRDTGSFYICVPKS